MILQNQSSQTVNEKNDLEQYLHIALKAVRLGRSVLMSYFGHLKNIEKKTLAGLVSEADRETEKAIQKYLKEVTPDFYFLGEESAYLEKDSGGQSKSPIGTAGQGQWILDPLDGTTNYIHQFPIFCISLGLKLKDDLVVGVIDVPMLHETYTAVTGRGAYVNGQPLHVSKTKSIEDSLLSTGFFSEEEAPLKEQLQIFSDLVRSAQAIRRPGAAAYDLCQVARGVFDGFWEKNLQPWDTAAGVVLVREAGGEVLNYQGNKYQVTDNSLIAGNKDMVKLLQSRVSGILKL